MLARWLVSGRLLPNRGNATIAQVIVRFWPWVQEHYRRADGSATSAVQEFRYSLRPLVYLYGKTLVAEFGPLAFKSVRQLMITGYEHPKYGHQAPASRGVINQRMGRIRRFFK